MGSAVLFAFTLIFSTCQPEPEVKYVEVEVPGETVYLPGEEIEVEKEVPVPNLCGAKTARDCATNSGERIMRDMNRVGEFCAAAGCANGVWQPHMALAQDKYDEAVMESWIGRKGGVRTKEINSNQSVPYGVIEPVTGREIFPCLSDLDFEAGLQAAWDEMQKNIHPEIELELESE